MGFSHLFLSLCKQQALEYLRLSTSLELSAFLPAPPFFGLRFFGSTFCLNIFNLSSLNDIFSFEFCSSDFFVTPAPLAGSLFSVDSLGSRMILRFSIFIGFSSTHVPFLDSVQVVASEICGETGGLFASLRQLSHLWL